MNPCTHRYNYEVVEAHPWQRLEEDDDKPDGFFVAASGVVLECRCLECGAIFEIEDERSDDGLLN
jgi:hypothetical protein